VQTPSSCSCKNFQAVILAAGFRLSSGEEWAQMSADQKADNYSKSKNII